MGKEPMSAKTHFMRGAIALAANGIPIFNALNNRGDDAKKFGELDDFGGHCGKGDDYHYHDAPVFLEKTLGNIADSVKSLADSVAGLGKRMRPMLTLAASQLCGYGGGGHIRVDRKSVV